MAERAERTVPMGARSVRPERPGEVVCICDKHGNLVLCDPDAWWRKQRLLIEKARKERESVVEEDHLHGGQGRIRGNRHAGRRQNHGDAD